MNKKKITTNIVFLHKGKKLTREEAFKFPVIVPGIGFSNPEIANVFDSEESFVNWAQSTKDANLILDTMEKIKQARTLKDSDLSDVIERKKLILQRTADDVTSLAQKTGLSMGSEELFIKATTQTNPLEEPVFDPISLCSNLGSTCAIPFENLLHLPGGGWPDLGWFNWNDKARSFRVSGFAILYEHTWWGGRTLPLWIGAFGMWGGDLRNWGFDRLVSSAWVA